MFTAETCMARSGDYVPTRRRMRATACRPGSARKPHVADERLTAQPFVRPLAWELRGFMTKATGLTMTSVDAFLPFMHDVGSTDRSLRELNLMWRMIESSVKMNYADAAGLILPTMASTRQHFNHLEEELVGSLVREKVATAMREITTKAQYVIDIVVRNLYERTADVGFLATDPELCAFVAGAGTGEGAGAVIERLRAYRSKYTVYDAIVLLDCEGAVLAQVGDGEPLLRSNDPLVAKALVTDGYVEIFRPSDLRPGKRNALVYAKRMLRPGSGMPGGVLCLCFNFEQEMESIFFSHRDTSARYNMLLLDADGRCIASADEAWVPLGARVPLNRANASDPSMYGGRQYLVSTFNAQGYQGYPGPPGWQGHVMIPLDVAFRHAAQEEQAQLDPVLRQGLLAHAKNFCPPLHQILTAADTIRRVVWNGQVMTAGRRDGTARLRPVLEQISETGHRSNELFASSIRELYATVLSASMHDSEFVSHLLVDLLDRNLYERADDCRWWALNPVLRRALATGDCDATARAHMEAVLKSIHGLYTVYTRLFVYDRDGRILAQSNRTASPADRLDERVPADVLKRVAALGSDQGYVVSAFEPSPLYEGRATYVYHAAIRAEDNPSRVAGGIGIVFDAEREFTAMLADGLAGKPHTTAYFLDRNGRIIATTDDSRPVGSVFHIDPDLLTLANGSSASRLVVHDGDYAILGCTVSSGYREFKVSDGYTEDVIAVVCERFGVALASGHGAQSRVLLDAPSREPDAREFATFSSGGVLFALETDEIREARPASDITRVSIGCPPRSVGLLTAAEGGGDDRTMWVFDLGSLVTGAPSPIGIDSQVVVVSHEGQVIGLLSEALHAVSSFSARQVSETPISSEHRLVRGIVKANAGGGLIQWLDMDNLFRLFRDPAAAGREGALVNMAGLRDAEGQDMVREAGDPGRRAPAELEERGLDVRVGAQP